MDKKSSRWYNEFGISAGGVNMRRLTDIIISSLLIIVSLPVMLITALIIRLDSPGPAIFKQQRIGKDNKPFTIYKFRTMYIGTPDVAKSLIDRNDSRITRIGRFLRKTSIDELPQLFNILKGDMTFIGPRPALYNQYDLIQMRTDKGVHVLTPGVTGYAQVNGREDISLEQKVEYDEYYLKNKSLALDLKILFDTIREVFISRGAY